MEEKGEEEINHSKGRRKIEIKKIDVESKRQVTFSKRRAGLFKKASEISILCGVQAAVIVVSPKERVFTSGHPNVDTVVNQFVKYYGDDKEEMDSNNMKKCLEEIKILEEKRRLEEVKLVGHEKRKDSFWWSKDVDRMGLEELENFVEALEELKENVKKKIGNGG